MNFPSRKRCPRDYKTHDLYIEIKPEESAHQKQYDSLDEIDSVINFSNSRDSVSKEVIQSHIEDAVISSCERDRIDVKDIYIGPITVGFNPAEVTEDWTYIEHIYIRFQIFYPMTKTEIEYRQKEREKERKRKEKIERDTKIKKLNSSIRQLKEAKRKVSSAQAKDEIQLEIAKIQAEIDELKPPRRRKTASEES